MLRPAETADLSSATSSSILSNIGNAAGQWRSEEAEDTLLAVCEYGPVRHHRLVRLEKRAPRIWIGDWVEGAEQEIEQYWHLGEGAERLGPGCFRSGGARLTLENPSEPTIEEGWRSHVLGSREPAAVLRVDWEGAARRTTIIDWEPAESPLCATAEWTAGIADEIDEWNRRKANTRE